MTRQKLIDLVNSVPPDLELPPLTRDNGKILLPWIKRDKSFSRFRQLIGGVKPDKSFRMLFSKLNIGVVHASATPGEPDAKQPRPPATYNRVIGEYLRLRCGREFLRWIATIPKLPMRWSMPPIPLQSAQTNQRGELHFVSLFREFEGVEAQRIRICRCRRIYWAKRKDQPGCRQQCVWQVRQQRWRKRYLERYKMQRVRKT